MRLVVALPIVLAGHVASAGPQLAYDDDGDDGGRHEPNEEGWRGKPAVFEWSTWVRLGAGVASTSSEAIAKGDASPTTTTHEHAFEAGLGADVSLPFGKSFRMGVWGELQNLEPVGGVELVFTRMPRKLDIFQFVGEGVLIARAGGNRDFETAALAWGYRCPWKLWGPFDRTSRYEIGVRFVASATRAVDDPHDWRATFGIEFEPVGSIRYLFMIRDWYRTD